MLVLFSTKWAAKAILYALGPGMVIQQIVLPGTLPLLPFV